MATIRDDSAPVPTGQKGYHDSALKFFDDLRGDREIKCIPFRERGIGDRRVFDCTCTTLPEARSRIFRAVCHTRSSARPLGLEGPAPEGDHAARSLVVEAGWGPGALAPTMAMPNRAHDSALSATDDRFFGHYW